MVNKGTKVLAKLRQARLDSIHQSNEVHVEPGLHRSHFVELIEDFV